MWPGIRIGGRGRTKRKSKMKIRIRKRIKSKSKRTSRTGHAPGPFSPAVRHLVPTLSLALNPLPNLSPNLSLLSCLHHAPNAHEMVAVDGLRVEGYVPRRL